MRIPLCLLLLPLIRCQESSEETTSNLIGPRDFNYHPYQSEQYLKEVEPTKKGPVVFPNDGPPPPKKPPLIVTSRPLIESIRRSELNPDPQNETIPNSNFQIQNSNDPDYSDYDSKPQYSKYKPDVQRFHPGNFKQIDELKPHFRLKPGYLKPIIFGRIKDYKPFVYPLPHDAGFPVQHTAPAPHDFQAPEHSGLPPIYKAIADYAQQRAEKLSLKEHVPEPYLQPVHPPHLYNYQQIKDPGAIRHHPVNHLPHQRHPHDDVYDDDPSDYAFSYKVRDHLTGDDFSHSQHSSGSATNGEYRVRLPDGRMQIVKYTADQNGYKADVRYDDEDKMVGNTLETHDDYKFGGGKHDHEVYNVYNDRKVNNPIYEDYKPNYNPPIQRQQADYNDNKNYNHDYNLINSDYFSKNDYKDDNENLQNRDYKPIVVSENYKPVKESPEEYNQYTDLSNENENNRDYSVEYDGKHDNYEPHQSKFSAFSSTTRNPAFSSTTRNPIDVKPTLSSSTNRPLYEELREIFIPKKQYNEGRKQVELNVPSTTPSSLDYGSTTEHVVIIGTKPLYTNINTVTPTQSYLKYTTPNDFSSNLTPGGYLVNTIAHLKKGEKPVLSSSFIDRVNKYLTFT